MSMQVDRSQAARQLRRLKALRPGRPTSLAIILDRVRLEIDVAVRRGTSDAGRIVPVSGPGGLWEVLYFAHLEVPYVGLRWPPGADQNLVSDLIDNAATVGLTSDAPNHPPGELWIKLG